MATITLAASNVLSKIEGSNGKIAVVSIAGSGSYATGGDTLDASAIFAVVDCVTGAADGGRYKVAFDRATNGAAASGKVLIYDAGAADGGDEVANTTDLSAQTLILQIMGR